MELRAVFWDLDGTLIDSEPLWHEAEISIATENGGTWNEEMGWKMSGTPVPKVAQMLVEAGTRLSVEEIGRRMIEYVKEREFEGLPWIPGALELVRTLAAAGVPNVLVTASPRVMAENVLRQAGEGAFVAYVCGDDNTAKKPSPEPYQAAARKIGIDPLDADAMAHCITLEDSGVGIQAGAASGATTIALTGYTRTDATGGPQFAMIPNYDGITPQTLEDFVHERLAAR
ncbi:HAD family hydrolase [Bifidobacterium vespertilionis]|uniref:HAD family phosphatase n=1 Tax=Bifidobacterium vespertilionis TaxID=2562524 RepID=A0A5J5DT10_9BIFI|nr:HAD family phosphatase [Bifidobacterium vespertilionis]KAA8818036.1 HAD family phosphatase [Bifidobacterium vespertilionis]KAA8822312.1 HAD family phosphatase [Bifidobacterium vespertilionis]